MSGTQQRVSKYLVNRCTGMSEGALAVGRKVLRHNPKVLLGSESIPTAVLGPDVVIGQLLATVATKGPAFFGLCWGVFGVEAGRVPEGGE